MSAPIDPRKSSAQRVASVGIANPRGLAFNDARGQAFALRHVEDRILPHHRHEMLGLCLAFAFCDPKLLDEVDLGAVFAFTHASASLLRLFERDESRRWPASAVRAP